MTASKSTGICQSCQKTFSGAGMARHLSACRMRKTPGAGTPGLHLAAASPSREYWMHLEVTEDLLLRELDRFLRETWLEEPCGHLSLFIIGQQYYLGDGFLKSSFFMDDLDLDAPVGQAAPPGTQFVYEYDMGNTTTLDLRVIGRTLAQPGINLLARNDPPEILCPCGTPAVSICTPCREKSRGSQGLFCSECVTQHEWGQQGLRPAINSPRAGICAYGDSQDPRADADGQAGGPA